MGNGIILVDVVKMKWNEQNLDWDIIECRTVGVENVSKLDVWNVMSYWLKNDGRNMCWRECGDERIQLEWCVDGDMADVIMDLNTFEWMCRRLSWFEWEVIDMVKKMNSSVKVVCQMCGSVFDVDEKRVIKEENEDDVIDVFVECPKCFFKNFITFVSVD